MVIEVQSTDAMRELGAQLGRGLRGGEVLELVGDVGAGKTTFTKGLAVGIGVDGNVQSPSFTVSQVYDVPDSERRLVHYDFYRLTDPGIMADELQETVSDSATTTVIEWADTVRGILPESTFRLTFTTVSEDVRQVELPDALGEIL